MVEELAGLLVVETELFVGHLVDLCGEVVTVVSSLDCRVYLGQAQGVWCGCTPSIPGFYLSHIIVSVKLLVDWSKTVMWNG